MSLVKHPMAFFELITGKSGKVVRTSAIDIYSTPTGVKVAECRGAYNGDERFFLGTGADRKSAVANMYERMRQMSYPISAGN